jgi:DNA-directed RNA polymerase specialized sigma24 family protein
MLNAYKRAFSHEDLFMQRYGRLLGWSLQLTGHDRQQAEDLVHDAFIQFTVVRPDLDSIANLEGYLYATLRNMHLSQLRRAARIQPLSLIDYDSAEIGLRAIDMGVQAHVKDQLRAICHYACIRKDTSKSGGVLILRFFHGYYPGEIARILRGQRRAVDDWMRIARREAKLYLEEPRRLSFVRESPVAHIHLMNSEQTTPAFLAELRQKIFQSRSGKCLPSDRLEELYRAPAAQTIDCPLLAHIVSCPDCLERINRLLGLPPLSERYPTDMIGPDSPDKSRDSLKADAASDADIERHLRRRARQVYEHSPRELHVLVNGNVLGSQTVNSSLTEQTLSVSPSEELDFIEVFSEQGIRLLYLGIRRPIDKAVEQHSRVLLSEGRTFDLSLRFQDDWPRIHSTYYDPLLEDEAPAVEENAVLRPLPYKREGLKLFSNFYERLSAFRFFLRPGVVTMLAAAFLIAALVVTRINNQPVTATGLLLRAAESELALTAAPETVLHKAFSLEERGEEGLLVSRRRIEIWASAEKGLKARRAFDENNRLVAGEWSSADGSRTIYRGSKLQTQAVSEETADILERGDIWQMEPSASDFSLMIGDASRATVEERPGAYVINYRSSRGAAAGRVVRASLTLNKTDLHPIEQVLFVQTGRGLRQYRFVESSFERRTAASVAPAVFQPEPELAAPSGKLPDKSAKREAAIDLETSTTATASLSPALLAEYKIEALYQLHLAGACTHEQVRVGQTPEGELLVEAIVETDRRKQTLLDALSSVASNTGVRVEVSTVAEALSNQVKIKAAPALARRYEIRGDRIAAYAQLYSYLSGRSENEDQTSERRIQEEIRRFASRLLNRSRLALLHAWALKHMAEEFPVEQLRLLGPRAQEKWRSMAREHARVVQQETAACRLELQPVFFASFPSPEANDSNGAIAVSDVGSAIERLFEMATNHEQAMRQAFAINARGSVVNPVATEAFWRSLLGAERLAARIP